MQLSETFILSAERLTKIVGEGSAQLTILHEISFQARAGESIAIVGASGSGKSTLLSLLAGLDVATSGRVQAFGRDLGAMDEDARAALRAQRVGFVFQSFYLLASLTALENVTLPLELMGGANARERAAAILQRVGLGERLQHYPRTLSGGEQQRVALARAFVTTPQLLFADEPTGNLDAATGAGVVELMFELNREQGTTLLLVTHDEKIAQHCKRRLQLSAGRLSDSAARV